MKSYAAIDSIEAKSAVCELELLDIQCSKSVSFRDKETIMVVILLEEISKEIGDVQEGDILVVEHNDGIVLNVCCKDDAEKSRRIELLKAMMEKMKK